MTSETLVSLRDIGLDFKQRTVLDQITLDIHRREILTIIGPNGAGKSCLLKIVLGLYQPSRGSVTRTNGLTIGYMPQKLAVDPSLPLTVDRFLRLANAGDSRAIDQTLQRVGADSLRHAAVQCLSGGEFQRVLLARALLRSPDLLVLDEPAQGVDLQGQQSLYRLLAQLREEHGFAILMVSHDLHFVMAQTDRVLCLNQHVCCSGTAEAVVNHPEYLALFSSGEVQNIGVYTHHHDHHHDLHGQVVDEAPRFTRVTSTGGHVHGPGCSHDHKGQRHD